jgi:hypothetical protein
MRVRQIVVAVVLLGAVAALSGCAGSDGLLKGVESTTPTASTPADSPAASQPAASQPGGSQPGGSSAAASSAAPVSPATLVLADTGIGGLHLGQSKEDALATGLIGKIAREATAASAGCTAYNGKRGIGLVYFSAGKVMIISATKSIQTDKGVGIGDTYLTLHQQYPDAIIDDSETGRLYPAAPKAQIKAGYRIAMSGDHGYPDDKILELALQANAQPCYE